MTIKPSELYSAQTILRHHDGPDDHACIVARALLREAQMQRDQRAGEGAAERAQRLLTDDRPVELVVRPHDR